MARSALLRSNVWEHCRPARPIQPHSLLLRGGLPHRRGPTHHSEPGGRSRLPTGGELEFSVSLTPFSPDVRLPRPMSPSQPNVETHSGPGALCSQLLNQAMHRLCRFGALVAATPPLAAVTTILVIGYVFGYEFWTHRVGPVPLT